MFVCLFVCLFLRAGPSPAACRGARLTALTHSSLGVYPQLTTFVELALPAGLGVVALALVGILLLEAWASGTRSFWMFSQPQGRQLSMLEQSELPVAPERSAVSWGDLMQLLGTLLVGGIGVFLFMSTLHCFSGIAPNMAGVPLGVAEQAKRAHDWARPFGVSNGYGLFRSMTGVGALRVDSSGFIERQVRVLGRPRWLRVLCLSAGMMRSPTLMSEWACAPHTHTHTHTHMHAHAHSHTCTRTHTHIHARARTHARNAARRTAHHHRPLPPRS